MSKTTPINAGNNPNPGRDLAVFSASSSTKNEIIVIKKFEPTMYSRWFLMSLSAVFLVASVTSYLSFFGTFERCHNINEAKKHKTGTINRASLSLLTNRLLQKLRRVMTSLSKKITFKTVYNSMKVDSDSVKPLNSFGKLLTVQICLIKGKPRFYEIG